MGTTKQKAQALTPERADSIYAAFAAKFERQMAAWVDSQEALERMAQEGLPPPRSAADLVSIEGIRQGFGLESGAGLGDYRLAVEKRLGGTGNGERVAPGLPARIATMLHSIDNRLSQLSREKGALDLGLVPHSLVAEGGARPCPLTGRMGWLVPASAVEALGIDLGDPDGWAILGGQPCACCGPTWSGQRAAWYSLSGLRRHTAELRKNSACAEEDAKQRREAEQARAKMIEDIIREGQRTPEERELEELRQRVAALEASAAK